MTISVDGFPDPIVGYGRREGSLVVVERNAACERVFGSAGLGTTVGEWLTAATGADDRSVADLRSTLDDGRPVDMTVGGHGDRRAEYRLRSLADTGETDDVEGFLLVTEVESTQSSDVEVDRIASVISHDLRNPLDVANIHLRAARETGDAEHFEQVRQSHDRMQRIIQDVLTLARGEHVLDVTAGVDVESVARDAWATVETDSASLTVAADLPAIDADPDRLQRLFENLFRNAVEHGSTSSRSSSTREDSAERSSADSQAQSDEAGTAPSEPSVADTLEDTVEPEGGSPEGSVEVRVGRTNGGFFVADDGVGIPPTERERVFDPGYSANGSSDGTGLGLTIVERIAEAHDWTVSLTAGSAGGARFEFRSPSNND